MTIFPRLALFAALAFAAPAHAVDWTKVDPENVILLELVYGPVYIETRPDKAPNHVARIKELARQGFYDGLKFHRVIEGFMAQTGGYGQNLKAEFSRLRHMRGVTSMARSEDPDSADSQFFIMYQWNKSLDYKYTVWGRVIEGMEYVDQITKGDPNNNGVVEFPDRIIRMRVAADVPEAEGGPPAN